MLLILSLYLASVHGRDCVDNVKGTCEASDLFGWCFHDKISGAFNCDSSRFCANEDTIRGKLNSTGCFGRGSDNIKCCCNEADMCNYNFLNIKPKTKTGFQSCVYTYDKPGETVTHFKNCLDPWCFAYFKYDVAGDDTILRGCQSRAMQRFKMDRKTPIRIANRIYFDGLDDFPEQPRCEQFASEDDNANGTIIACLDLFSKQNNQQKIGRLCCCRGSDECNAKIGQYEKGKTIDEVEELPSSGNFITSFPPVLIDFMLLRIILFS